MIYGELVKIVFKTTPPNKELIETVLREYDGDMQDLKRITDKKRLRTLETSLHEQPSWLLFYSEKKAELSFLLKLIEKRVDAKKGELWKSYTENYNLNLSQTDKQNYIANESEYLDVYEILLMVKEMYDRYGAAVDALVAQGYALSHIARMKIKEIE